MKRETLFLKVVTMLSGIPILAFCIWGLPRIAVRAVEIYPKLASFQYPALLGLYAAAVAFFWALYQTLKLLSYIDKNKAFSELSVKALTNIKHCAMTISILLAACLPILYYIADVEDAPGILVLGIVPTFAVTVIAVFAAVLQKLLKNALDIKSEHDLTV